MLGNTNSLNVFPIALLAIVGGYIIPVHNMCLGLLGYYIFLNKVGLTKKMFNENVYLWSKEEKPKTLLVLSKMLLPGIQTTMQINLWSLGKKQQS